MRSDEHKKPYNWYVHNSFLHKKFKLNEALRVFRKQNGTNFVCNQKFGITVCRLQLEN